MSEEDKTNPLPVAPLSEPPVNSATGFGAFMMEE